MLGRLRTTPPTTFNYVMPKEHHYIYLIQKCDSRNGSYHKIMAAANEGFRRFIVFSAAEQRSWRLALLYGETTEVLREFEAGDVWHEYLKVLDSNVVHRCNASSSENVFQEVMKVIPKALPTTIVALLDSSMLNTEAIQKLKTQEYLRLSLVLFDAGDLPGTVLSNAPTNTKLFVVPSQLDQEAMAASIDLALHNIHHSTAVLYGDITKVTR
ncbi:uncharacterized protein LOC135367962 [Ornithodoros turicata]|uniref:uncharacterized protein LOC135367962 n=1 Tax=Ornithodoros turicata TaxID=34597 RepID=UPI0031390BA1